MPLSRDPDARQTLIEDALQDPTTTNRTLANLRETANETIQSIKRMEAVLRETYTAMEHLETNRLIQRLATRKRGRFYLAHIPLQNVAVPLYEPNRPPFPVSRMTALVEASAMDFLELRSSAYLMMATENLLGLIGREARQATDDAHRQRLADTLEPFSRNLPDSIRMALIGPDPRRRLVLEQSWLGTSWCLNIRQGESPDAPPAFLWQEGWVRKNATLADQVAEIWVGIGRPAAQAADL